MKLPATISAYSSPKRSLAFSIILIAACTLSTAGCSTNARPQGKDRGVPLVVLTESGPFVDTVPVFAATSLGDLKVLMQAAGVRPDLATCNLSSPIADQCWLNVKPEPPSFLIAVPINVPCARSKSVTARMTGERELTISVVRETRCQSADSPRSVYSLTAIHRSDVPASLLSIVLSDADTLSRTYTDRTTVDLRAPLDSPASWSLNLQDAAKAVAAAKAVGGPSVGSIAGRRWVNQDLACSQDSQGHPFTVVGYVVTVVVSSTTKDEYHWANGRLTVC